MVKKIIILISVLMLAGCQKQENLEDFNVSFFYLEDCGHCQAFKENTIPYLKKEFKESIHINYYNMDEENSKKYYHEIANQLENYDEDLIEDVPFFVLDDYFALLGYGSGEEKYLAEDIRLALKNQPLTDKLELYRWEFKHENN